MFLPLISYANHHFLWTTALLSQRVIVTLPTAMHIPLYTFLYNNSSGHVLLQPFCVAGNVNVFLQLWTLNVYSVVFWHAIADIDLVIFLAIGLFHLFISNTAMCVERILQLGNFFHYGRTTSRASSSAVCFISCPTVSVFHPIRSFHYAVNVRHNCFATNALTSSEHALYLIINMYISICTYDFRTATCTL